MNNANQIEHAEPLRRFLEKMDAERETERERHRAEKAALEHAVHQLIEEKGDDGFTLYDVSRESGLPMSRVRYHEQFVTDLVEQLRSA